MKGRLRKRTKRQLERLAEALRKQYASLSRRWPSLRKAGTLPTPGRAPVPPPVAPLDAPLPPRAPLPEPAPPPIRLQQAQPAPVATLVGEPVVARRLPDFGPAPIPVRPSDGGPPPPAAGPTARAPLASPALPAIPLRRPRAALPLREAVPARKPPRDSGPLLVEPFRRKEDAPPLPPPAPPPVREAKSAAPDPLPAVRRGPEPAAADIGTAGSAERTRAEGNREIVELLERIVRLLEGENNSRTSRRGGRGEPVKNRRLGEGDVPDLDAGEDYARASPSVSVSTLPGTGGASSRAGHGSRQPTPKPLLAGGTGKASPSTARTNFLEPGAH